MLFYITDSVYQVSVPLGQVYLQEMANQTLGLGVESLREGIVLLYYFLVHLHGGFSEERRSSADYFVYEHTEAPPICGPIVSFANEDFRSDVVWGAANGIGSLLDDFSESEISELEISFDINEDVFRLEISIGDVVAVQVLEGEHNLGGVETGGLKGNASDSSEIGEKFSARHEFHDVVDVASVLVEAELSDDERTVHGGEDEDLVLDVVHLLFLNQVRFTERLECIKLPRLGFPDQKHCAKGPRSQNLQKFEPVRV